MHKQIFNSPLNLNSPPCFYVHDCTLLSAGAELILKGVRREPFMKVFGITFRNHHFDKTCSHRRNMKFRTVLLQIGNLQCPSVPKSLISHTVLAKNFNRNINEVNISYK